ncbi:TPA: Spy/CpxP family protein refolding chaperone [Providencia alcalifaciens]
MQRIVHRTKHSSVHKTAAYVLASAFVFGPVAAFGEASESSGNDEPSLVLQMQPDQPLQTTHIAIQFQLPESLNSDERASEFMFNGITLSEKQRQQLRDLMATQRHRHVENVDSIQERESLHKLIIADRFDDKAVRAQLEKQLQKELDERVEMARIHHELYQLLTPEQKAQLEQINQHKFVEYQVKQ